MRSALPIARWLDTVKFVSRQNCSEINDLTANSVPIVIYFELLPIRGETPSKSVNGRMLDRATRKQTQSRDCGRRFGHMNAKPNSYFEVARLKPATSKS